MWANRKNTGFTIVELLIVIVVIGILAAIVIVAYNGITSRAHTSTVKNDLTTIAKKLEVYKVKNGTYPTNITGLEGSDIKVTKGSYDVRNNLYYVVDTGGRWYAIGAITQNTAHCLVSGQLVENGGNGCNSYDNTLNNVIAQADAAGVTITSASAWNSVGYDWPDDGAGAGWSAWAG